MTYNIADLKGRGIDERLDLLWDAVSDTNIDGNREEYILKEYILNCIEELQILHKEEFHQFREMIAFAKSSEPDSDVSDVVKKINKAISILTDVSDDLT